MAKPLTSPCCGGAAGLAVGSVAKLERWMVSTLNHSREFAVRSIINITD